nr:DUF4369 domain-containing protein [Muribaculaceae bacterium]
MKRRELIASALIAAACLSAHAAGEESGRLTIQVPTDFGSEKVVVRHNLLDNMIAGRRDTLVADTLVLVDGKASLSFDPAGAAYYFFNADGENNIPVFAKPGENITVNISAVTPGKYVITGSPLMEGISEYNNLIAPLEAEYAGLMASGQASEETIASLMKRYDDTTGDFINKNINSPVVTYVLLNAQGEEFIELYDRIGSDARSSILMPMVDAM